MRVLKDFSSAPSKKLRPYIRLSLINLVKDIPFFVNMFNCRFLGYFDFNLSFVCSWKLYKEEFYSRFATDKNEKIHK